MLSGISFGICLFSGRSLSFMDPAHRNVLIQAVLRVFFIISESGNPRTPFLWSFLRQTN